MPRGSGRSVLVRDRRAALVAVGVFVALPDDDPRYLGDMPSQIEQAQAESVRAEP